MGGWVGGKKMEGDGGMGGWRIVCLLIIYIFKAALKTIFLFSTIKNFKTFFVFCSCFSGFFFHFYFFQFVFFIFIFFEICFLQTHIRKQIFFEFFIFLFLLTLLRFFLIESLCLLQEKKTFREKNEKMKK